MLRSENTAAHVVWRASGVTGGCRERSEREGLIGRLVLSGGCRGMRKRVVQLHKPGDKPEVKGSCSPGAMLLLHLSWNFISIRHDSCESFTNRTGAAEKNINVWHTCITHTYCCLAVRVCRMETASVTDRL